MKQCLRDCLPGRQYLKSEARAVWWQFHTHLAGRCPGALMRWSPQRSYLRSTSSKPSTRVLPSRAASVEQRKAASAGSDAHTESEIGRAYVLMPDFNGPEDFLSSLGQGQIVGQKSSYLAHFASTWAKIRRHISGSPYPDQQ
jgi:hypothetical protein